MLVSYVLANLIWNYAHNLKLQTSYLLADPAIYVQPYLKYLVIYTPIVGTWWNLLQ